MPEARLPVKPNKRRNAPPHNLRLGRFLHYRRKGRSTLKSAVVQNGLFEVTEDDRISHLLENGKKVLLHQSKTGKYKLVYIRKNGKQLFFYVHRLYAEAFVPNPDNGNVVKFRDGNPDNLSRDNLFWANWHDFFNIVRQTPFSCPSCGGPCKWENYPCSTCQQKARKERRNAERREKYIEETWGINEDILTPRQKECVRLRRQGLSIVEIAKIMGVSHQASFDLYKKAFLRCGIRRA